ERKKNHDQEHRLGESHAASVLLGPMWGPYLHPLLRYVKQKQHLLIQSAGMKQLHRHLIVLAVLVWGCATAPVHPRYDAVIRNAMIYDGSGSAPYKGDVAIQGDAIAAVGDIGSAKGSIEIDAHGHAVAPGFIN